MLQLLHNEATNKNTSRRRPSVELLIAELRANVAALEEALRQTLEASPTKDPKAANYPILARNFQSRLVNLRATIAALESARPQVSSAA
jgi:hypothetical protein